MADQTFPCACCGNDCPKPTPNVCTNYIPVSSVRGCVVTFPCGVDQLGRTIFCNNNYCINWNGARQSSRVGGTTCHRVLSGVSTPVNPANTNCALSPTAGYYLFASDVECPCHCTGAPCTADWYTIKTSGTGNCPATSNQGNAGVRTCIYTCTQTALDPCNNLQCSCTGQPAPINPNPPCPICP